MMFLILKTQEMRTIIIIILIIQMKKLKHRELNEIPTISQQSSGKAAIQILPIELLEFPLLITGLHCLWAFFLLLASLLLLSLRVI